LNRLDDKDHFRKGPLTIRLQKSFLVGVFVGSCLAAGTASADPTVWSGLTLSFSKAATDDYTQIEFQDHITENVALTRGDSAGMYNVLAESSHQMGLSPADTEWATSVNNPSQPILATNWAALNFSDWRTAYGGAGAFVNHIVSEDAVVHLITDDIYLDFRFTNWGIGHTSNQGAFAYIRAEAIPEPSAILLVLLGLMPLALRRRIASC
jgi:hypothetical protein